MASPDFIDGEYLGFIDLREHFLKSPIAMAILSPPRHHRESSEVELILGPYGKLFGGEAFPASVYCMQDPITTSAQCNQACIIMATSLLADREAVIRGSYSLTSSTKQLLKGNGHVAAFGAASRPCKPPAEATESFRTGPMGPRDSERALQNCKTSPRLHSIELMRSPRSKESGHRDDEAALTAFNGWRKQLGARLVDAYISARLPVILLVDAKAWYGEKLRGPVDGAAHMVCIVGIRRSIQDGNPTSFIVHDPGERPFIDHAVEDCWAAAEEYAAAAYEKKTGMAPIKNNLKFIAVADQSVRTHAWSLVDYLFGPALSGRPQEGAWNEEQLRFAAKYVIKKDASVDYRIRLLSRDSLAYELGADPTDAQVINAFVGVLLEDGQYWCVIGLEDRCPTEVWMMAAGAANEPTRTTPFYFQRAGTKWKCP